MVFTAALSTFTQPTIHSESQHSGWISLLKVITLLLPNLSCLSKKDKKEVVDVSCTYPHYSKMHVVQVKLIVRCLLLYMALS